MIEHRYFTFEDNAEIATRNIEEDGRRYIMGYGSVVNSDSQELTEYINGKPETFVETISKDAFNNTDLSRVFHLVDHDMSRLIGRTGANTIVQRTDKGLFFKTEIPSNPTTEQEDLYRNVSNNIIRGSSFAFTVKSDKWYRDENKKLRREILDIGKVFDVTSTANPAYEDAYTFKRTLDEALIEQPEQTTVYDTENDDFEYYARIYKTS